MSIAQRGTTSSSTGYQTIDRWQLNTGTQQEQKTDTPDARFSNSFEITGNYWRLIWLWNLFTKN